jgi:phosphoribosylanthranilate isomerase
MVWVKICGITNSPDAKAAIDYGAQAMGFVFAPSKRQVSPVTTREIIRALPPETMKVGVFANQDLALVREIAAFCGLTSLQLHGDEPPAYCAHFEAVDVIKAFRVQSRLPEELMQTYILNNSIRKVLLDSYTPEQLGGTGKTFDWQLAAKKEWLPLPVIIAGGLNPENVIEAIRLAQPFGVDVSSGVEKAPGQKDLLKLKAFIKNARGL